MNNRTLLVLLGAGASHAARQPCPPLGSQLIDYITQIFDQYQRDPRRSTYFLNLDVAVEPLLKSFFRNSAGLGYEQAIGNYIAEIGLKKALGDELLRALTQLTAVSMLPYFIFQDARAFPNFPFLNRPDLFDQFLSRINRPINEIIFVTLNYDILLEQALIRTGHIKQDTNLDTLYGWQDDDDSANAIVLKMHGSANWVASMGPGTIGINEPIGIGATFHTDTIDYSELKAHLLPSGSIDNIPSVGRYIAIAHFCRGKPAFVNKRNISLVRSKALAASKACTEAIVIGVHPPRNPDDDALLDDLLNALRGKKVCYVGVPGDDTDAMRMRGFTVVDTGFEKYVTSMQD